jgi:hypothetical protein
LEREEGRRRGDEGIGKIGEGGANVVVISDKARTKRLFR